MRVVWTILAIASVCIVWFFLSLPGHSRDDGRYANNPLKPWFDSLASDYGLCCSVADGRTIDDPDIDMDSSPIRVRIDGVWYPVNDKAILKVPNKYGRAVAWPYSGPGGGGIYIRCFLPGAGT